MQKILLDEVIAIPPEWAPQHAVWTAWPADLRQWNGDLASPRHDVACMVRALAESNLVRLLVNSAEAEASAHEAVGSAAEIVHARYGDVWLRDTGPIFAHGRNGPIALRFRTNGWGGKFDHPDDTVAGDDIADLAGVAVKRFDFVLEGGAVELDGKGTVLTTRQTLLNQNRNGWSKEAAEAALVEALGVSKIVWIDEGLANDHTDGHVDNVARFAGPGLVVCQAPCGADDPNAETLEAIAAALASATDAKGASLEVIRIPGVGLYRDANGDVAPASHLNFVVANGVVVVPVYGTPSQDAALEALREVFPGRKVIGVSSRGLLGCGDAGGGSFHCITRQEPQR